METKVIEDQIKNFCQAWITSNLNLIDRLLTKDKFIDIERVFQGEELIHQEEHCFSKIEFIEHTKELFTKRDYLLYQTNNSQISIHNDKATFVADLKVHLKENNCDQTKCYDNCKTLLELCKTNNKWLISKLDNTIYL